MSDYIEISDQRRDIGSVLTNSAELHNREVMELAEARAFAARIDDPDYRRIVETQEYRLAESGKVLNKLIDRCRGSHPALAEVRADIP